MTYNADKNTIRPDKKKLVKPCTGMDGFETKLNTLTSDMNKNRNVHICT